MAIALRAARDAALLLAAGAALFLAMVGSFPHERRLPALAGAAAAVLTLACLGWQGTLLRDAPGDFGPQTWAAAMRTTFGTSSVVAFIGSCVIVWAALLRGSLRTRVWLLVPAALACGASLALTGHSAAAEPRWASGTALATHAVAGSFWFGSLAALWALLRADATRASASLQRFSRLAIWGVALLLAAGAAVAAIQLPSLSALTHSSYGRLVLLKAALAGVLLCFAAGNRFVLVPQLARGAPRAPARLRASVAIEIALVLAVLVVTAVLVQTPPHAAAPLQCTLQGSGGVARLTIDPGEAGENRIELLLADASGRPLDAVEVELELSNRAAGMEPLVRKMPREGPGRFGLRGSELALRGRWTVTIRAHIGDFDLMQWSADIEVR